MFRIGALWQIDPRFSLGLMVQPPGAVLGARATVNGTSAGTADGAPIETRFYRDGIGADSPLPFQARLGASWRPSDSFMLNADAILEGPLGTAGAPIEQLRVDPSAPGVLGGVLCPQREARCADGRVRQDDVWARDGGAPSCPESASTVTASPTGVALEVVASLESGFTTSLALVFVPGHFEACRHPRLMVSFSPRGGLSYEETFPVEAELDLGDATVPMAGEVVISEHDQELARFTGTISMAGAGYTVEGAFEVTACPDLHRHSI
ncbi:MAG: hypothetical protein RLO52_33035 [Sandaracinaceae bacterium]